MMQITVDPAGLSSEQREAVAGFILAYPAHSVTIPVTPDNKVIHIRPTLPGEVLPSDAAADGLHTGGAFPGYTPPPDDSPEMAFGGAASPLAAGGAPVPPAPSAQPPAAAITPAPTPAPPAPATATPAVALDKAGLPWDGRIHSSNKATVADGTWRKKRGVTPELVAGVEAELRAVMGAPTAAQPAATATTQTVGPAPSAAPAPVPPAPAAPTPPAPSVDTYVALVGRASAALQAHKLTPEDITATCVAAGIPALPMLANRPDLVPTIAAQIDALIASRG